ncbi:hypothetical protein [Clostridiisalibacter paucivorans]|uniref:hypothetical protein n=1 Tax=Clostridiisalibacter paucivorans TaxID=408753 RepID=UPI00047A0296|nr:hypothetical protein [Clostridiisalibacter paucivorans]
MKRLVSIIIIMIMVFSYSVTIFANSGPVYWKGYPSSDIMIIEEESPIEIKKEYLVFDFSNNDNAYYTVNGKVRATYEMVNNTDEGQNVEMAFPLVSNINNILKEEVTINADGLSLPYSIYIGDGLNNYNRLPMDDKQVKFDFKSIVDEITDKTYSPRNFTENEIGKLYKIKVIPTSEQRINFAIDFSFNHQKTKIFVDGFNSYQRNNKEIKIAARCYKPKMLEIFVIGEDIDLDINGYIDGEFKKETDLYRYEIYTEKTKFKSYLVEHIKEDIEYGNEKFNTQLYNMYAKLLDNMFDANKGYIYKDDIMGQSNYNRILTLVYDVYFPKKSEKDITVVYNTSGTMDMTETPDPLYSFDYILNPAKNWRNFKDLSIKIIPPKEAPYIVSSNIEFDRHKDGFYTAELSDLPEQDLSFTLYSNEKVTLMDRVHGRFKNTFGYFTPVAIGMVVFIILLVIIIIYRRKKNSL